MEGDRGIVPSQASESPAPAELSVVHEDWNPAAQDPKRKRDRFRMLSAAPLEREHEDHGNPTHHEHERPLPYLLTFFVCFLALLSGLGVAGFHTMVKYGGCPLGINGCNKFGHEEDKSSLLVEALVHVGMPLGVVYVLTGTIGCSLCGLIIAMSPDALRPQFRGGGTTQALVAVASGKVMAWQTIFVKPIITSLFLGAGASMGGEGPAVQICVAIAGNVGRFLGIHSSVTQSLLASLGLCCGFAASFNAPMAGILFALEELSHVSSRLSKNVLLMIIMSTMGSVWTVRAIHGNHVLFHVEFPQALFKGLEGGTINSVCGIHMWMLIAAPIGIICAWFNYAAVCVIRLIHKRRDVINRMPVAVVYGLYGLVSTSLGSVVFKYTGLRGVWGIGNESLQATFDESLNPFQFFFFATAKILALALGLAIRAPAGMLVPVLISGGFLGGMVGQCLPAYLLEEDALKVCVVFGMVGFFAACFRTPLTPIMVAIELTGIETYALALPCALSSSAAIMIANRLGPGFLDEIFAEDGINLEDLAEAAEQKDAGQKANSDAIQEGEEGEDVDEPQSEGSSHRMRLFEAMGVVLSSQLEDAEVFCPPRSRRPSVTFSPSDYTSRRPSNASQYDLSSGRRNSKDQCPSPRQSSKFSNASMPVRRLSKCSNGSTPATPLEQGTLSERKISKLQVPSQTSIDENMAENAQAASSSRDPHGYVHAAPPNEDRVFSICPVLSQRQVSERGLLPMPAAAIGKQQVMPI